MASRKIETVVKDLEKLVEELADFDSTLGNGSEYGLAAANVRLAIENVRQVLAAQEAKEQSPLQKKHGS